MCEVSPTSAGALLYQPLLVLTDDLLGPQGDGDSSASGGGGSDLSSILGISNSGGGGSGGSGGGNQLNEKLRILTDGVSLLLRVSESGGYGLLLAYACVRGEDKTNVSHSMSLHIFSFTGVICSDSETLAVLVQSLF